jgi:sugar fermentation stimulation protein A
VTGGAPVEVRLPGPLVRALFVERPNRFVVRARLPADLVREPGAASGTHPDAGAVVDTHMADPGRLSELLVPGVPVWLRPATDPGRKTRWSTVLVQRPDGEGLVSVDTTLPNRLVGRALEARALSELGRWDRFAREWRHGPSRFDFLLTRGRTDPSGPGPRTRVPPREAAPGDVVRDRPDSRFLVLEVKSVTLVEERVALFPDAVTARGARHVRELADLARHDGWEAAVLFVLQRPDADRIVAAREIDADFADALEEAREAGVAILGRRCSVELGRVVLGERVRAGPG